MAKKNKKNDEERLETKWEVFMRNYKNVPGFKELIKLLGYFLFLGIFILIVVLGNSTSKEYSTQTTTTTSKVEETKTYKEILTDLYTTDKEIHATITIADIKYTIDASNKSGILTGFIETINETKRFKIENNVIYELNLDVQTENKELFNNLIIDYIIPANLVNTLENNKATKRIEDDKLIYNYNLEDNSSYNGEVIIIDDKIASIKLSNATSTYEITYE